MRQWPIHAGTSKRNFVRGSKPGSVASVCVLMVATALAEEPVQPPRGDPVARLDPAAWGGDHIGKPFPAYVTGDECLFCHRRIGPTWGDNRHQRTIRRASPDEPAIAMLRQLAKGAERAAETNYVMGSQRSTRFLKRSPAYGKLELLSASLSTSGSVTEDGSVAAPAKWRNAQSPQWDETTFADRCAGCHTTAVQTQTRSFSALSLDCFSCHGDVNLEHSDDVRRVLLSTANRQPRQVISICGQCHLRGGKSRSSGLPYPNAFVAGDNLFRDFQIDLSDAAIDALPLVDQHIHVNARDVAVFGRSETTCLTCHDLHRQSSEKHQQLENTSICASCHVAGTDNSRLKNAILPPGRLRAHSRTCDY